MTIHKKALIFKTLALIIACFSLGLSKSQAQCSLDITGFETPYCDGQNFQLLFILESENTGESGFTISVNGQTYGTYAYDQNTYASQLIPLPDANVFTVLIYDLDQPDCGASITLTPNNLSNCNSLPCGVTNLDVEFLECQAGNVSSYSINFTPGSDMSGTFSVSNGGQSPIGTFSYEELPVTVSMPSPVSNVASLYICPDEAPDCCFYAYTVSPDCNENPTGCYFDNVEFTYSDCTDNAYTYILDFDPVEVTNEFFDFITFGNPAFYAYADLPIEVSLYPADDGYAYFTLCDNDNPDCCQDYQVSLPDCNTQTCDISVPVFELHECNDAGQVYVDFEITGLSEGSPFSVTMGDVFLGNFTAGETFYTVGPFAANGSVYNISVNDLSIDNCQTFIAFITPDCTPDDECNIDITYLEYNDCMDDGYFSIDIAVTGPNAGVMGYHVLIGDWVYGPYNYGDQINTVGGFALLGDGESTYEILVYDVFDADCSVTTFIDALDCTNTGSDCNISINSVEYQNCNEDGEFYVHITVSNENSSGSFSVVGNGLNYGTFEYGELYYNIGPFAGTGGANYELIIVDNQNENCNDFVGIINESCTDCNLDLLWLETSECTEDGFYVVNFGVGGLAPQAPFAVYNGDEIIAEFFNIQDSYTVGPFPGNGENILLTISALNLDNCYVFATVISPECDGLGDECNIEITSVEYQDCNATGQFEVHIGVANENSSGGFSAVGNGQNYGSFEYGETHYVIGPFDGGLDELYEIIIIDNDNENCSDWIGIESIPCTDDECSIQNFQITTTECDDNNTYDILIEFEAVNPGNDFVDVYYGDQLLGFFPIDEFPITIENFPGLAVNETITVCINDNPDCCATATFLTPGCQGLIIWPGDTDNDGISNNFDILNLGIAFGSEGFARDGDATDWTELQAAAWESNFNSGINYAYADADGNGEVSFEDTEVISSNYGETHGEVSPHEEIPPSDSDPVLFVDIPDDQSLGQGDDFTAAVVFGTQNLPVESVYGLAFTINFDPSVIDPASVEISYPISWLGVPQTNLMTFDYKMAEEGKVDVSVTKIDQNNTSGWGQILHFIGIIDNIAGKEEIIFSIDQVKAIRFDETRIGVNTPVESVTLTSLNNQIQDNKLYLYPNPAQNEVHILNETEELIQNIVLRDLRGKLIKTVGSVTHFSVEDLSSGVYLLEVSLPNAVRHLRLVKTE